MRDVRRRPCRRSRSSRRSSGRCAGQNPLGVQHPPRKRAARSLRLLHNARWLFRSAMPVPASNAQGVMWTVTLRVQRDCDQDRHADSGDTAVDFGGHPGPDFCTGRTERQRCLALYARRDASSFGANTFFDFLKLRGFDAPRYLDGLRLPNDFNRRLPCRASSLTGLSAGSAERAVVGLYGQSDPGGLINMVSKRPTETPHHES